MVPEKFTEFIDDLTSLVKKNVIPMTRIDDAVRRILRVKFVLGLFENPMADYSLVHELGSQVQILLFEITLSCIYAFYFGANFFVCSINSVAQEHRELASEAVRKSLVLLKNGKNIDEPLLPLPKRASKILVAGSHAHNIGNQCGGWTIEWRGLAGNITVGMFHKFFK